jgi:ubiquinol-cytochrome c reductase iron-sulfur subunit
MADQAHNAQPTSVDGQTRRDFLLYATSAVGVVGTGIALWPFVHSMNPAADTLALSTTDVDIAAIQPGQAVTVIWQGKPVFVRRRLPEEIAAAEQAVIAELRDPQADADRIKKPEWLILVGVCTHLGCVPLGQKPADPRGEFGGWFCPCHGSHYDTSGRIRKGPAPRNLPVPPYKFTSDTTVRIG